ncbi:phosphoribosylaminoimidazolesuccinocarboxamide synthase [Candidatus Mesenet endosymbiont of Agriotes lineatus]|uniref:phosphoribosylaminoimidazolesuccinocarboxamide synthase n=1 Tax=Candidatus Mesenet endosymbiont of Agriotes lineatus TaxID=3077948 RepID=UPI0030D5D29C
MHLEKIYEGKAKIIFASSDSDCVIQHFKDDISAFNKQKFNTIYRKGIINNHISAALMQKLEIAGVNTHFVKILNEREQLVKKVKIIPLEVVIRNFTAGSFCKRFNTSEGMRFSSPIIEFFYKNDSVSDPLVNEDHILYFKWLTKEEINEIKSLALCVNSYLANLFFAIDIKLVDLKLEFGKLMAGDKDSKILLADEISPDNCRLWDIQTNKKLDKDCYRLELGEVIEMYEEVAKRLGVIFHK